MSEVLIEERSKKLHRLRQLGIDPYGGRFPDAEPVADVRRRAEDLAIQPGQMAEGADARTRIAGRIILLRDIGKLIFITLRGRTGDIQIGLTKGALGDAWQVAKLLDLGDIIGVDGTLGRTKTNEITVWTDRLTVLCKSLEQPPEKYHGLHDVEIRYRRRYVDLNANPDVTQVFLKRARIIDSIRRFLVDRGFVEVETPMLQPIYGGAAARPFVTHHNTLDIQLYLRISPELYLKRLLVGGMERVFEINRNFRNEGISTQHNPEFTMLEVYQAYGDYNDMMELMENMVAEAARAIAGVTKLPYDGVELDCTPPWPRNKYADLLAQHAGASLGDIRAIRDKAERLGIDHEKMADAVVINKVFEATVQEHLVQPQFVLDYPAAICPLTRRHPDNPELALRFEAFACGMEIGNSYTELNDPAVQRANFSQQLAGEGEETMRVMDEDFVRALEVGMPPAGGLGVGIDRLTMLLCNCQSIRDVILFPLQRPREEDAGRGTGDEGRRTKDEGREERQEGGARA